MTYKNVIKNIITTVLTIIYLFPSVCISAGPTDTTVPIWIIGDSTVCNYAATDAHRGWGQVIGDILVNGDRVINRARSGASSKSFIPMINKYATSCWWGNFDTNKWGKTGVKESIAKADTSQGGYLFIQFGHNDTFKKYNPEKNNTVPGLGNEFDHYLMEYISFAESNNVTPVLITPMARMFRASLNDNYVHIWGPLSGIPAPWEDMNGKMGDWPQTIKDIGARENITVLDLTTKSKEHFATFDTNQAILDLYSWNKKDFTHFNETGARKMAEFIRELALESGDEGLAKQFKPLKTKPE